MLSTPSSVFRQSKEKAHTKKKKSEAWKRVKISICKPNKIFGHLGVQSTFKHFLFNVIKSGQFSESTCPPRVMVIWCVSASWASAIISYFGKCRPLAFTRLKTVNLFQGAGKRFALVLLLWVVFPFLWSPFFSVRGWISGVVISIHIKMRAQCILKGRDIESLMKVQYSE